MKKYTKYFVTLMAASMLAACASHSPSEIRNAPPTSQLGLRNLQSDGKTKASVGGIRVQAIRDTALSLGARGGLAHRAKAINLTLLTYEPLLNRVFNFTSMLLEDNVMPPVLIEGRNTLNLTSDDVIHIAQRQYTILRQARFVTAAPTWREYLWMGYSDPELPDKTLLPKDKGERIIWKKYIDEGWEAGLLQADVIFSENIARLKRDYEGMIRYRNLLAKNMVSPPYVASVDMGITGGGHDMTVNDRILRITAFPELQADGSTWKTELKSYE